VLTSDDDEIAVEGRHGLVTLLVLRWTLTNAALGIENASDVARNMDENRMLLRLSIMMERAGKIVIG